MTASSCSSDASATVRGVKMRIRRIGAKDLRPGALIEGDILLEANDSYNIDNMEGIAAHW
jgi:hypothetical protein